MQKIILISGALLLLQFQAYAVGIQDLKGTYVGTAFEDKSPCVIVIGTVDPNVMTSGAPLFLPVNFVSYSSSSMGLSILTPLDINSDSAHRVHLRGKSNDGRFDQMIVLWLDEKNNDALKSVVVASHMPNYSGEDNSSICRDIVKK